MSAVDLNDGAEDDYLKLEKFWSAVHEEAIDQGLQTGWSVWKELHKKEMKQIIMSTLFDLFNSMETLEII